MSFLRKLLGGGDRPAPDADADATDAGPRATPTAADLVAEEQDRERELLRADAQRLDDDLIQRQMRYADRAWTPPAQGGTRRSDDEESRQGD